MYSKHKQEDPVEEHSPGPLIPLELFQIKGVGYRKALSLVDTFGSLGEICRASVNDIVSLPGFGIKLAKRIVNQLREEIRRQTDGVSLDIFSNAEEAEEMARHMLEMRHRLANQLAQPNFDIAEAILEVTEDNLKRFAVFTPKGDTWGGWRREIKKVHSRLNPLVKPGGLFSPGAILTCPRCHNKGQVIRNGFEDGIQKFHCRGVHDEEMSGNGNQSGHCHFTLTTSLEAQKFVCEVMKQLATTLIYTNSPLANAARLFDVSTYFAEMVQSMMADAIIHGSLSCEEIDFTDELLDWEGKQIIPIWMDFSGSAVAKRLGLLLAKVGGQAIFDINPDSCNLISALKMLRNLKAIMPEGVIPVFVTDGEGCLATSIREIFPEAIHVRQFHSKASRGLIHVHFPHEDRLYTFECRWDLVLEDGEASKRTNDQRLRRAGLLTGDGEPGDDSWKSFPDYVALYRGVILNPRRRRKRPPCSCQHGPQNQDASNSTLVMAPVDACDELEKGEITSVAVEPSGHQHDDDCPRSPKKRKNGKRKKEKKDPQDEKDKLCEMTKEEAMAHPICRPIIMLLQLLFGGLYITSNIVENCFDAKQWLKQARAMKSGCDSLMFRLWSYFIGSKMVLGDLQTMLDEIFTREALHTYLLPRKRRKPEKSKKEQVAEFMQLVDAELSLPYEERLGLVIEYMDREKNYSGRAIIPEKIVIRSSGDVEIHAYCCKRKKRDRTFLLSRVQSMARVDDARRLVLSLS